MSTRCKETGLACSTAYGRGCRCDDCKALNAAKSNARRRQQGAKVQLSRRPGVELCTVSGRPFSTSYRYGCRCDQCVQWRRTRGNFDKANARERARQAKTLAKSVRQTKPLAQPARPSGPAKTTASRYAQASIEERAKMVDVFCRNIVEDHHFAADVLEAMFRDGRKMGIVTD